MSPAVALFALVAIGPGVLAAAIFSLLPTAVRVREDRLIKEGKLHPRKPEPFKFEWSFRNYEGPDYTDIFTPSQTFSDDPALRFLLGLANCIPPLMYIAFTGLACLAVIALIKP